ncbi:hypothetical protein AB3S75_002475 [Citrus x aurantiifolia]
MPISRLLFFSSKHRFRQPLNLIRRFDLSKRTQSCSYTKSSRQSHRNPADYFLSPQETKASRSWSTYFIPAVGLLGLAGIATFVHYNDERRAVRKGTSVCQCVKEKNFEVRFIFTWANYELGDYSVSALCPYSVTMSALPSMMFSGQGENSGPNRVTGPIIGGPFTLIDTENRLVTENNFLGNWVLLYFGYTSSPDVGPEQVQMMAKAIDILDSKKNLKILPIFVTIDPQRDTPAHLRAYLKEFNSRIVGLTGSVGAIRQMAQEYRVFFKKVEEEGDDYLVESSHNMYFMNPSLEVVRCFGVEYTSEELAEEISKEMKKAST